jgi:hypothetical protein
VDAVRIQNLHVSPHCLGSARIDLQSSFPAYRQKFLLFLTANDHFADIHEQSFSQGGTGVNFLNGGF